MSPIIKICLGVLILGIVAQSTIANVIDVYHKGIHNIVYNTKKPTVVYYYSSSCTICNIVLNKLADFEKENSKSLYIAKVDFDKHPELKEMFDIDKVPTTHAYKKGELVDEVTGPVWPRIKTLAESLITDN